MPEINDFTLKVLCRLGVWKHEVDNNILLTGKVNYTKRKTSTYTNKWYSIIWVFYYISWINYVNCTCSFKRNTNKIILFHTTNLKHNYYILISTLSINEKNNETYVYKRCSK